MISIMQTRNLVAGMERKLRGLSLHSRTMKAYTALPILPKS